MLGLRFCNEQRRTVTCGMWLWSVQCTLCYRPPSVFFRFRHRSFVWRSDTTTCRSTTPNSAIHQRQTSNKLHPNLVRPPTTIQSLRSCTAIITSRKSTCFLPNAWTRTWYKQVWRLIKGSNDTGNRNGRCHLIRLARNYRYSGNAYRWWKPDWTRPQLSRNKIQLWPNPCIYQPIPKNVLTQAKTTVLDNIARCVELREAEFKKENPAIGRSK